MPRWCQTELQTQSESCVSSSPPGHYNKSFSWLKFTSHFILQPDIDSVLYFSLSFSLLLSKTYIYTHRIIYIIQGFWFFKDLEAVILTSLQGCIHHCEGLYMFSCWTVGHRHTLKETRRGPNIRIYYSSYGLSIRLRWSDTRKCFKSPSSVPD